MRKPSVRVHLYAVLTLALAALIALSSYVPVTIAQEAPTVQPSPTGNGGSATWTVSDVSFTSQYPDGGQFTIRAESSAGPIKTATLFYRHNPSNRQRALGKFDAGTGLWTATGIDSGTPQWVAVEYWWSLTDEAGNNYVTDIMSNMYADTRREWAMTESEDIIVYWETQLPENMGDAIVQAMADRRQFYLENWGQLLPYKPRAVIFDGEQDAVINEWSRGSTIRRPGVAGSAATILGGFTRREYGAFIGIYRTTREDPVEFALSTVLHEVGHLYQYENGGFDTQGWFTEGNAEYMIGSRADRRRYLNRARAYAVTGEMPTLSDLGGREQYDVGFAFFIWFTEKYGEDSHLKLMQIVAQGGGTRKALERFTGMTFLDIETEFREWLGAPNGVPPTSVPEPTVSFFFPSPTFAPTRTPKP
jgi:hypothetical protein